MNGLFVVRVQQDALVLVKNVNHGSLEARDSARLLVKVHEIGHDLEVRVGAVALVLHPLLDDVAQAGREHHARYGVILERLEERLAVAAQVSARALNDVTEVVARDARVHEALLRLRPPLDHVGQLLLLGHRVVVLDRVVVVEQVVQRLTVRGLDVIARLEYAERGRARFAVEGHAADGAVKVADHLEATLTALSQVVEDEVDSLAVLDLHFVRVQFRNLFLFFFVF